ncbi:MAG TPA: tetratricopeptide repeat protein [Pyrinomonadaceae bacterium]|jgi:tetratricopeptide (TPR) repeat protein
MKFSSLFFLSFFIISGYAQQTPPTPRTHVERFSTPEARALRIEQETTEKLQKTPNDAEILNDRALARLRLQKFAEAFEDLKRAAVINPKQADYRANLGYVLWKLGKGSEAIDAERAALKLDEKNYTANYQLGRFLLRTGDKNLLKEATERLKKALEIDARQYEVRFELIAAFRELGDTASALAQLDILQDAKPSDARVVYVSALLFVDRNDFKAAETNFREAVQKDPNLYGAWQDLGLLYAKQNRWTEAVEAFSELAKKQQNSVDTAYLFALSLFNAKRVAEAETEVRRALRLDAGSAEAHTLLGIILASKGTANVEAVESLTQAVALAPTSFDAVFYLGRAQYAARDYQNSLKNLQTSVNLNPKNTEARFFLGTVLEAANESDKALAEYQEIVRRDEKSFYGQVGLGALYLKQGKLEDAVTALNQALTIEKESFEANWALGRALILQEKFQAAADVLQKAVSLQPARADARYQFAIALRRLGKTEEAKKEFDLVEKLNKEFREGKTP